MVQAAISMASGAIGDFVRGWAVRHDVALRKFLVRMLRNEADAADIAQETYLRVSRLTQPESVASPRQYLFQVASRLAMDHFQRQQSSVVPLDAESEQIADESASPERQILARDILQKLTQELPPKQRAALLMRHLQGLSRSEIAEALGTTVGTVDQYLIRAIRHCEGRLRELEADRGRRAL